jgi:AraC-like DNA-binding protein
VSTFKVPEVMKTRLHALGVDPLVHLRKSGLPLNFWTMGKGQVTTEQFFMLWRAISECTDDPAIGLKIAVGTPMEQHHPASIAAQHARTFRDALQRLARYKLLCASEAMVLTEDKTEARLEFEWLSTRETPPTLLLDATFASMVELGRLGTAHLIKPLRVEFARKPKHEKLYETHFGIPIRFNAKRDRIAFRVSDLDRPFVTYNAALLDMLSPQLDKELARRKAERTLVGQVKWVLKRLLGGHRPDLREVAKELGLSVRTLQRRITNEGASFRGILNDARRELAHFYLAQPTFELGETAYLLGFEDANSFFRAFREWEGATPTEWRKTQPGEKKPKRSSARRASA